MTRGQTIEKIKNLGFNIEVVESANLNGRIYLGTKADLKFISSTPMGLLKQIKQYLINNR